MGHRICAPFLFLLFACLSALATRVHSQPNDIADELNQKGIHAVQEGKSHEAIAYFESAYNAAPDNMAIVGNLSRAYHNQAISFAADKDWHAAISNELQALKHAPDSTVLKEQLSLFYNNCALQETEDERYDLAVNNLKQALIYFPSSDIIKANLYNILLKEAESSYKQKNEAMALSIAQEAVSHDPGRTAAYIFIGNLYYQQNNFEEALRSWEKARLLEPENRELIARIEKLRREQAVEGEFKTRDREYFKIRFEAEMSPDYIWVISDILEEARRRMYNEFYLYSDEAIPVIVYKTGQFRQATNALDWMLGLYDGKIRLEEQDISAGDATLKKVLYHEYAHAILYLTYGNNIPIWLNEGFAQYNEPESGISSADKNFLSQYLAQEGDFSLERLEGMFAKKNDTTAIQAAYLESKLLFRYLLEEYRKENLKRFLEALKQGQAWQVALREVYRVEPDRFSEDFNEYIHEALQAR